MSTDQSITEIVERHVAAFRRGDVATIMEDYAEDAVMLTKATGALRGKAAIAATYEAIFSGVFPPATTKLDTDPLIVGGEVALLHFSATTPTLRTIGAFDTFVIRDGKIVGQTGGGEFLPVEGA